MIIESILHEMMDHPVLFEGAVILLLIYYVLLTVAQWHIFKKAGEKGWKALIPFYSIFVSHHLIGMRHIWFILDIIFWVTEVILDIVEGTPLWLEDAFFYAALIFTLISEILHIMKLCYCYTKSELFGIGLFVLPPVFSMILAFDKSEYHPPRSHKNHDDTPKPDNTKPQV